MDPVMHDLDQYLNRMDREEAHADWLADRQEQGLSEDPCDGCEERCSARCGHYLWRG